VGPAPAEDERNGVPKPPGAVPSYVASLYDVPLLTPEQEVHLFRRMNYLKYKASKLREQLDPVRPKKTLMDRIEKLLQRIGGHEKRHCLGNLRLVVSIAKRHTTPSIEFFELVSDGNVSLIRAADKFDFARGNRFSTYASWAIMKNFSRTIPDVHRHENRFIPARTSCSRRRRISVPTRCNWRNRTGSGIPWSPRSSNASINASGRSSPAALVSIAARNR